MGHTVSQEPEMRVSIESELQRLGNDVDACLELAAETRELLGIAEVEAEEGDTIAREPIVGIVGMRIDYLLGLQANAKALQRDLRKILDTAKHI